MSFTIGDTTLALWFVALAPKIDFMLVMNRLTSEEVEVECRFRYHASEDPWDQNDRKHWYKTIIKTADDVHAVELTQQGMNGIVKLAALKEGVSVADIDLYELIRGAMTTKEFIESFQSAPFVHKREISSEEHAKYGDAAFHTRTQ